jgi:hypothetical protein
MLKISEARTVHDSLSLKLEGRVVGPWVDELRRICEPLLSEEPSFSLDLGEVSYADAEGVATLNSFKSNGVKLVNCSPFLEQQIKASN